MSAPASLTNGGLDPLFTVRVAPTMREDDLVDVASGALGVLRIPDFLGDEARSAALSRLSPESFVGYTSDRYPVPAFRIGPVVNEFRLPTGLKESYWDNVDEAQHLWLTRELQTVRAHCFKRFSGAWPRGVGPAVVGVRPLNWGVIREINDGTLLHWDDVIREFPNGLFASRPLAQLAVNIFLTAPRIGGEISVWRRRWTPSDESHRFAFGYRDDLIGPWPLLTVAPQAGDAVIFDSRNYHQVRPCHDGRRVALAFFLGFDANGDIIMWS